MAPREVELCDALCPHHAPFVGLSWACCGSAVSYLMVLFVKVDLVVKSSLSLTIHYFGVSSVQGSFLLIGKARIRECEIAACPRPSHAHMK